MWTQCVPAPPVMGTRKLTQNWEIPEGESLYFPGEDRRPVRQHRGETTVHSAKGRDSISSRKTSSAGLPSSGDCKSKHKHVSSQIGIAIDGQGAGPGTFLVGKSTSAQGDVDKLENRATKSAVDRERGGTEQRLEPLDSCEGVRKGSEQRLADNTYSGGLVQAQSFSGVALMAKEIRDGEEAGQLEGTMMFGADGEVDFFNRSEGVAEFFKPLGGPSARPGFRRGWVWADACCWAQPDNVQQEKEK
ncbi:hypothetical protein Ancab_005630 [Ancistrocladus abbreviatus]